jgi:hypothetical protein
VLSRLKYIFICDDQTKVGPKPAPARTVAGLTEKRERITLRYINRLQETAVF